MKTVNAARTDFLYDGLNPVQGLNGATVLANILGGLRVDEYFTRTDVAGTRSLLTDALGSTLALSDPTSAVTTEYTYEPFSDTTTTGASNGNTFQFTGRENDSTGLYYYRACDFTGISYGPRITDRNLPCPRCEGPLVGTRTKLGQTTLGTLTFTYDATGSRAQLGGSWASPEGPRRSCAGLNGGGRSPPPMN